MMIVVVVIVVKGVLEQTLELERYIDCHHKHDEVFCLLKQHHFVCFDLVLFVFDVVVVVVNKPAVGASRRRR